MTFFGFQNNFVDIDFRFLVGFGTADADGGSHFLLADFNAATDFGVKGIDGAFWPDRRLRRRL